MSNYIALTFFYLLYSRQKHEFFLKLGCFGIFVMAMQDTLRLNHYLCNISAYSNYFFCSGWAPLFQGPPCLWQGDSLHVRALLCGALQTKGLASQKQEPNPSKLCWPGLCRDIIQGTISTHDDRCRSRHNARHKQGG